MPGTYGGSGLLGVSKLTSPSTANKYLRQQFISHNYQNYSRLPRAGFGRLVLFNEMKYIHSMRGVFSRRIHKNGGIHT
jgi:hypothetical protein